MVIRSRIVWEIRKYMNERGYMEVETPILWNGVGGANATPFIIKAEGNDGENSAFGEKKKEREDYCLRIAPELFLKQMVVGGFDKVFEIGKVFRNEGTDRTHNPEFTTMEMYKAYTDVEELIEFTEELLRTIMKNIFNTTKFVVEEGDPKNKSSKEKVNGIQEDGEIDFGKPFKRVYIYKELEKVFGTARYKEIINNKEELIEFIAARTASQENRDSKVQELKAQRLEDLVDYVIEEYIEKKVITSRQPTVVIGHPVSQSPLSKESEIMRGFCNRFEVYVNGKELVNAYEELNDPFEQQRRFEIQQKGEELAENDRKYCQVLEYGLPPTGGWGMGIDRLVMMLTDTQQIRDVISFGLF
ncbi:putative lysine-tRNA ligase, cytoplasmic [Zancudomyces culisetae]|uniref:Putative lysine-tRNA ligase, cytoplasmic n=1 Tax=Zancudomyces culisetae TaxID=1213189 RepID=A0A1R1PZQ3_ZANCU|nr:putative lysine-tRNA ligase, cytoplasmic [Zancudomyces culisetae]|eukprot:OMH86420.1 putative lysine-tRNA ligase, cytoplasmic [Zancudomyces culisetae]